MQPKTDATPETSARAPDAALVGQAPQAAKIVWRNNAFYIVPPVLDQTRATEVLSPIPMLTPDTGTVDALPQRPTSRKAKLIRLAVIASWSLALGACTQTISPELRYIMTKPIECSQASQEIALLQRVRPDLARQSMSVISTVSPIGLVTMVASDDTENRRRVITGEHGEEIDRRIAAIQAHCAARPAAPAASQRPGRAATPSQPSGQPQPTPPARS
jgi:hypothetical protein